MNTYLKSLDTTQDTARYIITASDSEGDLWFLWAKDPKLGFSQEHIYFDPAVINDKDLQISDLINRFKMNYMAYRRASELLKDDWLWSEPLEDYEEGSSPTLLLKETIKAYVFRIDLQFLTAKVIK